MTILTYLLQFVGFDRFEEEGMCELVILFLVFEIKRERERVQESSRERESSRRRGTKRQVFDVVINDFV